MEVNSVITGSWFPRTKLHLKEYHWFLRDGRSNQKIDAAELKKTRRRMGMKQVRYVGGRLDRVEAISDDFRVTYFEDGLLTVSRKVKDLATDLKKLDRFYEKRLTASLELVYSIGTPVISYGPHTEDRPTIIVTSGASGGEAQSLIERQGEKVHFIARRDGLTVYYAEKHIVVDGQPDSKLLPRVTDALIFFREYEHRLHHYLEEHRVLWSAVAAIQEREHIPQEELPKLRNEMLRLKRDIAVMRARINQMSTRLDERENEIASFGIEEDLRALEAYRFDKMHGSTAYMSRLWEMLDEYLESTIAIMGLVYQDRIRREIKIQEVIFLVSAVAGIIALGFGMAGEEIFLYGTNGEIISSGTIQVVELKRAISMLVGFLILILVGGRLFWGSIRKMPSSLLFERTPEAEKKERK